MKYIKTNSLSIDQKRNILLLAKEKCYEWRVDILDCSVSFFRQKIDMSFDEIMGKFNDSCFFSVIHRNFPPDNYLEIGFSTMRTPEYFLWIYLDIEHIEKFELLCKG